MTGAGEVASVEIVAAAARQEHRLRPAPSHISERRNDEPHLYGGRRNHRAARNRHSGRDGGRARRGQPRYLDSHASVKDRVNDLLHRMTLEEKVGQMDQIVIGKLRDNTAPADGNCNNGGGNGDPLQTSCLQRVLIDYKTGSILSGGTDNPDDNTGERLGRAVQHDPALRGRALAPAHPGHLRGRRRARLRPSVPGAALPALDRHGRDLGHRARRGRRRRHAAARCWRPAATGTSRRFRISPATIAGAATTRRGPSSPRSPRRSAPPISAACREAASTRRRWRRR